MVQDLNRHSSGGFFLAIWGHSTSFYTFSDSVSKIIRTSFLHKLYGIISSSFGHQRSLPNFPYKIWQQVKYTKYLTKCKIRARNSILIHFTKNLNINLALQQLTNHAQSWKQKRIHQIIPWKRKQNTTTLRRRLSSWFNQSGLRL